MPPAGNLWYSREQLPSPPEGEGLGGRGSIVLVLVTIEDCATLRRYSVEVWLRRP